MKRWILTGVLAVAFGVLSLMAQPQAQQKGPAGGQGKQAQQGPAPKSQAEAQALQALFAAQGNPDAAIKAADDLLTKFADTDFKEIVTYMQAVAYEQKGDSDKAMIYAEKTLDVNPKNFQASLMIGQ